MMNFYPKGKKTTEPKDGMLMTNDEFMKDFAEF